ncbi:MAG: IS3 family transposase [Bifidobacterium adolescentis]
MRLEADDGRPEASPPLRRGVQTADRAARTRAASRRARSGPSTTSRDSTLHRWVQGIRNSGSTKAADNRTPEQNELIELRKRNRQLEMEVDVLEQAALIFARKQAVIRANASRYPISAQCRILGVPRSTYYWMIEHPEAERVDPIAGDVHAIWRDSHERYGARKIKAALERRGVTASRRRIVNIMKRRGMTSAYARRTVQTTQDAGQRGQAREHPRPRVRRLRAAHPPGQ